MKRDKPLNSGELRRQAEELLSGKPTSGVGKQREDGAEETVQLIHELQVHQIELEMQNEEMRKAQHEIEAGKARYFDLYDMAPVGYVTVGGKGLTLEANLTAATMLGVKRDSLVRQPLTRFILTEDQDLFYLLRRRLSETLSADEAQAGLPQMCELRMVKPDGEVFWVRLDATTTEGPDGAPAFRVILSDITERVQAEEAIRRAEKRSGALIENAPDGIVFVSLDGKFTYASPSTFKLFGYDTDEISRLDPNVLTHPDDLPRVLTVMSSVIQNPSLVTTLQYRFRHQDGRWLWIESTFSNLIAEPSIQAIVINFRDITERKRAEEVLCESEERFRAIANYAVSWESWFGPEGEYIWVNPAVEHFTGYSAEEILALPEFISTVIADEDRAVFIGRFQEAIRGSREESFEFRYLHKNGTKRWLSVSWQPIYDAQGNPLGTRSSGYDITARRQAEEALRASQQLAESIIQSIPGTFYMLDEAGRYVRWNAYQRDEIVGKPDDQIAGFPAIDTIHPDDRALVQARIANVLRTGVDETIEGRVLLRGGPKSQWLLMTGRQMVIEGHPYLVGIGIDITARRQAEVTVSSYATRLNLSMKAADMAWWEMDLKTGHVVFDERKTEMLGYAPEDFHHYEDFMALVHPDDHDKAMNAMRAHLAGAAEKYEVEYRLLTKQGRYNWFYDIGTVEKRGSQGEPLTVAGIVIDITARKRAEEENRRQSEQLRLLHDASHRLNQTLDKDEIYRVLCEFMSSNAPNDGFAISDFDPETRLITCSAYCMDNKWLDVSGFPPIPLEAEGKGTQSMVIRSGQPMLVPDFQALLRSTSTSYYVNAENNTVETVLPPEEDEITRSALIVPLKTGNRVNGVIQVMSYRLNAFSEDQLHLLEALSLHISSARQNAQLFAQVQTELSERKRAEVELHESKQILESVIENIPLMIFLKESQDLRFIIFNKAGEDLLGYHRRDLLGKNDLDLFPPEQAAHFMTKDREVLASGVLLDIPKEPILTLKKGERFLHTRKVCIEGADGNAKYLLGISEDITEREMGEEDKRKLEDQLRQAQKMEAVGRLAGGVAHDFNNLIMIIMGNVDLCRDRIGPDHQIHELLDEITSSAQRSAEITRQLLAFARKQTIAPKILNLTDAVTGMLKLLHRLIGEDIKLTWRPGSDLLPVKIDPSQVDQILANLCVNARDAIADAGEVTVETGSFLVDAEYCATHPEAVPGTYVFLAVSDDGCGMDQETLAQVFEPFFTTKGLGDGTGLGLATVYGIVKQNNGFIHTASEPGKGTTIKAFLPQAESDAVETPATAAAEAPTGHGETVLLVEDEKSVSLICRTFLEALDYKVLTAETPGEALKISERHSGEIHVLLTDVVMPAMDGRQLANRISAIKPGVKVLFMSGYTADVIAQHGVLEEGVQFLLKPFKREDLARKLQEVLLAD